MTGLEIITRAKRIRSLRLSNQRLEQDVVRKASSAILDSYINSSIASITGIMGLVKTQPDLIAKSIGIRRLINLHDFNDPHYIWDGYFSDVGRAVSNGEKQHLFQQIIDGVNPGNTVIHKSNPDFNELYKTIYYLKEKGQAPDTIIAPVYLLAEFLHHFGPRMDFECGQREFLNVGDSKLTMIWSNKFAPLDCFLIFNSNSGEWNYVIDSDTNQRIWVAVGESEKLGNVEYWAEVLTYYKINNHEAFAVIPVVRKPDDNTSEESSSQNQPAFTSPHRHLPPPPPCFLFVNYMNDKAL